MKANKKYVVPAPSRSNAYTSHMWNAMNDVLFSFISFYFISISKRLTLETIKLVRNDSIYRHIAKE